MCACAVVKLQLYSTVSTAVKIFCLAVDDFLLLCSTFSHLFSYLSSPKCVLCFCMPLQCVCAFIGGHGSSHGDEKQAQGGVREEAWSEAGLHECLCEGKALLIVLYQG